MQEGFVHSEKIRELVSNIKRLLEADVFDVVIATKFINTKGSMFEKYICNGMSKLYKDSKKASEVYKKLKPLLQKNEKMIFRRSWRNVHSEKMVFKRKL